MNAISSVSETGAIPRDRAWLALWTIERDGNPYMRCLAHDGPLPRHRAEKLAGIGGFERPMDPGESPAEVFAMFGASPGWDDPQAALREFGRIASGDPALAAQMRAEVARRAALVVDCTDWRDAVARLVKLGEIEGFKGRGT